MLSFTNNKGNLLPTRLFIILLLSVIMTACGVATNESTLNVGTGEIEIVFPASLDRNLSEGTVVVAKIAVDSGKETELSVDRNKMLLKGTIGKIGKGKHTLKVTFYYKDSSSGELTAIATQEMKLDVGDREIASIETLALVYLDNDKDGVINLAEIQSGTDLNDPESTPPSHGTHASENYAIKDTILTNTLAIGTSTSTNYTIK